RELGKNEARNARHVGNRERWGRIIRRAKVLQLCTSELENSLTGASGSPIDYPEISRGVKQSVLRAGECPARVNQVRCAVNDHTRLRRTRVTTNRCVGLRR